MRTAQERSQERLPPKKRDLPAAAGEEVGGRGREPSRYGGGGAAGAGLTLDQYGLLYKVAVPPVVSVSPLPPAFSVASPLLQHPAISYSPVHYAPLPPAPLHFVGSHYSVPYAVPPGFVPGHLLPTSPSLSASPVPQFVPYASLLPEEAAPHVPGFGKTDDPISPSGSVQPHGRSQLLDVRQSRFPVYYQMSHLPAGYSAFEVPITELDLDLPLQGSKIATANGVETPIGNTALDADRGNAAGFLPRTTTESRDVSVTSQRSTPDTDLEVQRVVGTFTSQDYFACSGQQKDGLSPLNLSRHDLLEQEEGSVKDPGRATAEKGCSRRPTAQFPEEELHHKQILRGLMLANGKPVSGSLVPAAQDGPGRESPEAPAQGGPPNTDFACSRDHLPSHFMKGAIIQLATGELKRVEDLQTQDFVRSAEVSGGLKIDSSTVVAIQESPWQGFVMLQFVVGEQQSKVSIDVPPEHPFFVYGQGWSSCNPERTAQLFALPCHRLQAGDVCISISLQSLNGRLASQESPAGATTERLGRGNQSPWEPQARAGWGSPLQKGAVSQGPPPEPSHLEPTSQHGWAGPSYQRFGEEPRSPRLRPSFIPQEVKLSIEGRSNAGK